MIVDIFNEVYTNIKTSLTSVTVLTEYPETIPNFPCVIIQEVSNTSDTNTFSTSGETYNRISFEVNIFSNTKTKIADIKAIRATVDAILNDGYGMTRDYSSSVENFIDTSVYRYVLRYSFLIDKNKTVYRG